MNSAVRILSAFLMVASAAGLLLFVTSIPSAQSAPQQAAVASMSMAPIICAYAFVRAVEMTAAATARQRTATPVYTPTR